MINMINVYREIHMDYHIITKMFLYVQLCCGLLLINGQKSFCLL